MGFNRYVLFPSKSMSQYVSEQGAKSFGRFTNVSLFIQIKRAL